ncbi:DUF4367 domain-containing protein [Anaerostipes butyraticus]|uniref:DUF4367 domain-containing protein n=1 Tax=Anaerostipes butyraticus TaxID=645466 RepID=A0A916VBJ2_9FIRM|nr:DUF4367 domain-containing protein [Anaerostipes butyraticus]GFO83661.1 hypothetical protein ANBU17_00080 [Anaerostipes butyraticus]
MKDNKKKIEEQEQLLDHLIEYGGKQYIDDEIQKFDELPEMDIPKDFDDRMDKMFKDAYRKEVRKERLHLGKKVAAAAVIVIGAASVTAMNVKAFREPILNFIFRQNSTLKNKTKVDVNEKDNNIEDQIQFDYIPNGYECTKIQTSNNNDHIIYNYQKENSFLYITIQLDQKYDNYINQSESGNYSKISINDQTFYFLKDTQNTLLFYNHNAIFTITSNESQSEMIKIAQNVNFKK